MAATRHTTRWKKSDLAWLALAMAVHCALLFTPFRHWQHATGPKPSITVQLVPHFRSREAQIVTEATPLPAPDELPAAPPRPTSEPNATPQTPASAPADLALPDQTTGEVHHISTATLVDLVSRMSFRDVKAPPPRRLGSSESSKQEPSWRTGARADAITLEANRFDGMVAPAETEVADRWQAADGSQNVVINTPGGETLCGRAQSWDPMHPLVEYVMLFRSCGGGGKRTFTMDKPALP